MFIQLEIAKMRAQDRGWRGVEMAAEVGCDVAVAAARLVAEPVLVVSFSLLLFLFFVLSRCLSQTLAMKRSRGCANWVDYGQHERKMSHVPSKGPVLNRCFELFGPCGRHTHDVRFRKRLLSGGEVSTLETGKKTKTWGNPVGLVISAKALPPEEEKKSRGGHSWWTERPISSGTRDSCWSLDEWMGRGAEFWSG